MKKPSWFLAACLCQLISRKLNRLKDEVDCKQGGNISALLAVTSMCCDALQLQEALKNSFLLFSIININAVGCHYGFC